MPTGAEREDPRHRGGGRDGERDGEQETDDAVRIRPAGLPPRRGPGPAPAREPYEEQQRAGQQARQDERRREQVGQQGPSPGRRERDCRSDVRRVAVVVQPAQMGPRDAPPRVHFLHLLTRGREPTDGAPRGETQDRRQQARRRSPADTATAVAPFAEVRPGAGQQGRSQHRSAEENQTVRDERTEEQAQSELRPRSLSGVAQQSDDQQRRDQGVQGILANAVRLEDGPAGERRRGSGEQGRRAGNADARQREEQREHGEHAGDRRQEPHAETRDLDLLHQPQRHRIQDRRSAAPSLPDDLFEGALRL